MDEPVSPSPVSRDGARPLALVVEGDAIQRIETADCVAEAGFEVIEAWNGPTALRQIERHPELRLIVIDADLSDPDGRFALVHAIARLRPGLALVAVSSGPNPEPDALPCDARFSAKPLGAALARTMREGLGG
ncbi:CheY-like chemotaxis protein [Methylorubrum rhodinum]|jgi:CheY-like chemotaxis protein|uniref:CheY-like chemotaxis protein n=1 Tax=Methylorubrum rhodinum TaxID=29428 RepID=A0A840ZJ42_9HYPH|nr:response regulator [Methylorubrum rhodinum]MBB5757969.1 CheY-like chemotaxis protein [Methylorubrum rhodinum]